MTACVDVLSIWHIQDPWKEALIECGCADCHIGIINNLDLGIVFLRSLPSTIATWHLTRHSGAKTARGSYLQYFACCQNEILRFITNTMWITQRILRDTMHNTTTAHCQHIRLSQKEDAGPAGTGRLRDVMLTMALLLCLHKLFWSRLHSRKLEPL